MAGGDRDGVSAPGAGAVDCGGKRVDWSWEEESPVWRAGRVRSGAGGSADGRGLVGGTRERT